MGDPTIEDLLRPERILSVMHDCENTVRWKASVQNFEINSLRWASSIREWLRDGTYKGMGFRRFDITERGKLRHIQAVHISERAVQKLLCRYALQPVIYPRLIYDNSACQENKGTEFALKRLKEHLRWHLARYGKRGTVVIMDYHGFFDSIPHEQAIAATQAHQTDPMIRKLIADFINAFDGDRGLGLGSEISQIVAALYPSPIDRYVKEQLRVHCYARYNDDSYMILLDRDYALYCLDRVTEKAAELGLEIHRSKTRIHNLASDDFEYLKKRIHITETGRIIMRLSRKNIQREEERIRMQRREYEAGRMPFEAIRQSYQCWRSYAQSYNAHKAVGNMDRYFVSVMGDIIQKETGGRRIDSGHTYPLGYYAMHEGELYRSTVAIPQAEEWDPSHWQNVTVGEAIEDLAASIAGVTDAEYITYDGSLATHRVGSVGAELSGLGVDDEDQELAIDLILNELIHRKVQFDSLSDTVASQGTRLNTAEGNISSQGTRLSTAETNITNQGARLSTAEGNITKLLARTEIEAGSVTLTNDQAFPFNSSQVTVPLVTERANQNYIVDYEVTAAVGNVGDIIVSAKLVNGFKIEFTGSATSVTVKYQVLGGMA